MRIDKKVYKYIDFELQHYVDNKKKLQELKEEILESSPMPPDGQPKGIGGTINPTEQKTVKLMSSVAIIKVQSTIDAIDRAYSHFDDDYKKFFDLNYKKNAGVVATCVEIGISEKTFFRWKDRIIESVGREFGII